MGAVYALSGSSTSLTSAAPLLLGVTTTAETGSVGSGCMAKTATGPSGSAPPRIRRSQGEDEEVEALLPPGVGRAQVGDALADGAVGAGALERHQQGVVGAGQVVLAAERSSTS